MKKIQFSSSTLRLIAFESMLIDHAAFCLLDPDCIGYLICRLIGRIAFPIFALLLVEGMFFTHSLKDYFTRLLFFSLISQLPYMLAGGVGLNIGFQLLGSLIVIYFWHCDRNILCILAGIALCFFSDYSLGGLFLILAMYAWCTDRLRWLLPAALAVISAGWCFAALLALPFIYRYNHFRGIKLPLWLVYGFYPAHLLLLGLLSLHLVQ